MASDPVETFSADADAARTRIAATIDEIQDRLDPRRIMNDAVDKVSGSGREMAGRVRDVARAHPLAIGAAIAAIGVALLARRHLANATVDIGDSLHDYTDYDDGYDASPANRAYADEADDALADSGTIGAAAARARDRARAIAARAAAATARASDSVEANPLISIVLGLAGGAVLGALFPATEAERRAIGNSGDRLGAAARKVFDAARDEFKV